MKTTSPLETLVQPLCGLINRVDALTPYPGEPDFPIRVGSLGDIAQALPLVRSTTFGRSLAGDLDGAGGSTDPEESRIKAIAESLERYSCCVYDERQFIWATGAELGEEAMDLDSIPVCSPAELSHPRSPVVRPSKDAPLRWVRAISLLDQRPVWVPAIMTYLHLPIVSLGERFWMPISTGCAAHVTMEDALVSAICEVIERDAISLTWYQQLQLPRIEFDSMPESTVPYLEQTLRGGSIKQYLFDGTTDLGVPTVYSLQLTPHNRDFAALIMCATDLDPIRAINKVMREAGSSRIAMMAEREIPSDIDDFFSVFHGAVYMGRAERLEAYDFLVKSPNRRFVTEMGNLDTGDSVKNLRFLLDRLAEKNMDVYAVDLTTDEAIRAGMRVVRVIIPGLQPLSFSYRCRYLGHPRLYEAPRAMGYPVKDESGINPWPQPFA